MQTFLPYADFVISASVLDRQRLGKQRVETLQLLKAIDSNSGWVNHPATKMWRKYKNALVVYGTIMCNEWVARGYKDTCTDKIASYYDSAAPTILPEWIGNAEFHMSHQSNLLRKDPAYYGRYFNVDPGLEYIWPV